MVEIDEGLWMDGNLLRTKSSGKLGVEQLIQNHTIIDAKLTAGPLGMPPALQIGTVDTAGHLSSFTLNNSDNTTHVVSIRDQKGAIFFGAIGTLETLSVPVNRAIYLPVVLEQLTDNDAVPYGFSIQLLGFGRKMQGRVVAPSGDFGVQYDEDAQNTFFIDDTGAGIIVVAGAPNTNTEIFEQSRTAMDLVQYGQARLSSLGAAVGMTIKVQYATDPAAPVWRDLCVQDASAEIRDPFGGVALYVGSWTDIPTAAKSNVLLRAVIISPTAPLVAAVVNPCLEVR